jgi:hypothetical protein
MTRVRNSAGTGIWLRDGGLEPALSAPQHHWRASRQCPGAAATRLKTEGPRSRAGFCSLMAWVSGTSCGGTPDLCRPGGTVRSCRPSTSHRLPPNSLRRCSLSSRTRPAG